MSWRREPVYLKKAKPLDGLFRERLARHDLPAPNPVRPGPGPEDRLRNLRRRWLPIGANVASAQKPYISGVPGDDPDYFPGDKYSCSDDENLNPEEEQRQVDAIKARRREVMSESRMREIRLSADRRKENKAAHER